MKRPRVPQILPAILGSLCQEGLSGTLVLEQNDGTRRIHWASGEIVYMQSDVAGEQFGNYLLRQGILDFPALSELLANEERFRLGEKVVQWGLLSEEDRDRHLQSLQEQIMIHTLEHAVVELEWKPGGLQSQLSEDLRFTLSHRRFIWNTFQEAHNLGELCDLLYDEPAWKWVAPPELLGLLGDLPLTPKVAYALSFWGPEPLGFETFLSLSGMDEEEASRLLLTLWALGGLRLAQGRVDIMDELLPPPPVLVQDLPEPEPPAVPPPPREPLVLEPPVPPPSVMNRPPVPPPAARPESELPPLELDFLPHTPPSVPGELEFAPIPEMPSLDEGAHEPPGVRARKCLLKAKNLLAQDRTAEAIRLLEQSVKLDPDSEQAYEPWLLLGKHRLSNPAWSTRAIEALQAASRLRPRAAEPWALMGEIYHRKGFKANAKACFRRALELDPSVGIPSDINLKEEDAQIEDKGRPGILSRFKAMLGRPEKD